ncbi:glycosyl hydrolase [Philodulcilactobacillus myokoensis]|uniref:Glycosyl hydrolase n=1 Tax=Philodulcilactobacillus myokoensis TaxID=2929573 RepID=A0A9W6B4J2_9LACO|nr:glycoside hydrolase family 3 C-terminal domain-containing protein [Philodulcilactobacillus myokoensis]GLB47444.1 glycosyl hydrolase [Philodulcilactobacillus myokoensis]
MNNKFNLAFVQKLTVEEKAALVTGREFWFTAENKDKNIPSISMSDGPSGLSRQSDMSGNSAKAVGYPSSCLTASSFDTKMLFNLGKHLGSAARSQDVNLLLGPGINIKRSPLGGRNFEFFSEDPYLTGELGVAYVNGVQYEGTGVSVKHFAANNRENQRFTASVNVDERTLREIYLPAFEKIVKNANPACIMCSYNPINGKLNSQNYHLLTEILRDEWGYKGVVMSDWGAVADKIASLNAGLDLEMPGKGQYSIKQVVDAVKDGSLEESKLNSAALQVLELVDQVTSKTFDYDNFSMDNQHQFSEEAAEDSMILLKNEHKTLPVKKSDNIAIIGQLAKTPRYQGGGSSHVNTYKVETPLQIAENSGYKVKYADGYNIKENGDNQDLTDQATNLAKNSDKVIFFAGVPASLEAEGFDKTNISLPDNQNRLIKKLAQSNSNMVVVLQNGSPVEMPWIDDVSSILESYLAGEAVGSATWNILTGKVNPSGKLPETFPIKLSNNPTAGTFDRSKSEENYHEGIFVGYRFYDLAKVDVNYPFGHGLSYTTFKYSNLVVNDDTDHVDVDFDIINTGDVVGKEVSQVYVQNKVSLAELPLKELKGFRKVELQPNQTKHVSLKLDRRSFAWYDTKIPGWHVDNGTYTILIGSSSRDIRLKENVQVDLGSNLYKKVTPNTYIKEVVERPDLQPALEKVGIKDAMHKIRADHQIFPIRGANMFGVDPNKVDEFIRLVNHK